MSKETYIDKIESVAAGDVAGLKKAQESYGDSWKKRGGVGAFMMLARKWDRIELQVAAQSWDVFKSAETDSRAEGVIDDIRDLRRYLLLVEAELLARGVKSATTTHRDNPTQIDGGCTHPVNLRSHFRNSHQFLCSGCGEVFDEREIT